MSAYDFWQFFFSATTLQYKQLKIEFYFSNESYNEEQEIVSIILPTSSFLSARLMKKNCIESASLIFFDFSIYIGLVILNQNQFMGILLDLFLLQCGVFLFICEFFCLMEHFSFCCYNCMKFYNDQKELADIINRFIPKYFLKRNISQRKQYSILLHFVYIQMFKC